MSGGLGCVYETWVCVCVCACVCVWSLLDTCGGVGATMCRARWGPVDVTKNKEQDGDNAMRVPGVH